MYTRIPGKLIYNILEKKTLKKNGKVVKKNMH